MCTTQYLFNILKCMYKKCLGIQNRLNLCNMNAVMVSSVPLPFTSFIFRRRETHTNNTKKTVYKHQIYQFTLIMAEAKSKCVYSIYILSSISTLTQTSMYIDMLRSILSFITARKLTTNESFSSF